MYLKHLQFRNIRCFADTGVGFDRGQGDNRKWTVLLGENGTGKSTVLRAAAAVMAGSDAVVELIRDPADWLRHGAGEGSISAVLSTKRNETREISLSFRQGDTVSDFLRRATDTLAPLEEALKHTTRNYPVFGYGASRRLGTGRAFETSRAYSHPRARALATLFDRHAQLNPLEQWAMRLDYTSEGTQTGLIKSVLDEFLGGDLSFAGIDKQAETLLFDTPDGRVALEDLSDGYQNVAAWVGDLLYQITDTFEDYQNPLHARGLLLIDEVDLHLHPKWQRRLIDLLDRQLPNMQILATTHSVVTAQQAPEGALHYAIRRDGAAPVIEAFTGDPGALLLNHLLVTEAFGHVSDESVDLERQKAEYRAAAQAQGDGPQLESPTLSRIAERASSVPRDPAAAIDLSPRQRELLQSLRGTPGEGDE
ncbi:MAG: AAA family ATPase [Paracoccaceae bacterium]